MGVLIQIEALKFVIGWFGSVGGFTEVDRSGGSRTQLNMMCAYASLSLFNGVNHQNPENSFNGVKGFSVFLSHTFLRQGDDRPRARVL